MITKHNNVNNVFIFEDGIAPTLDCDLQSMTWGRPLQNGVCNLFRNEKYYSIENIDEI